MLFNPSLVEVFSDWLERHEIQHALITARPRLDGRTGPHEERPLLRIPRQDGGVALVAKTSDEEGPGWVVGTAHPSTPTLRAPSTVEELVEQVLEALTPAEGGDR